MNVRVTTAAMVMLLRDFWPYVHDCVFTSLQLLVIFTGNNNRDFIEYQ
jgi:hypothetical protein